MDSKTLQLLNIDESLKNELAAFLIKFEGLRVGNDLSVQAITEEESSNVNKKETKVSRLIKRLFFTEYDAA